MIDRRSVRYFIVILFVVVFYLTFLVIRPFITPLLISMIFAFIFYPVFRWLEKRVKNATAAALIVSILFVLVVSIPAVLLVNAAIDEAQVFYSVTRQKFVSGEIFPAACGDNGQNFVCKVSGYLKGIITNPEVSFYINEALKNVTRFIIDSAQRFFLSIPKMLLSLFVVIFTTFYLIRDGEKLAGRIQGLLPLRRSHQELIVRQFHDVTSGIIFGYIITAIVQGIMGGIAFVLVGISSPILWGIIMMVAALIPVAGTALVWIPATLMLLAAGNPWQAGILLIAGIIISNIDNVIRPKLISQKAHIHPVLVLLGVIGGLYMFGMMGFLIGPLILALFLTFLKIYETEKDEISS